MKAPLLLIALALTACSKAQAQADSDNYRRAELAEYNYLMSTGVPPADARARIQGAHELTQRLENDPEANWKEAKRQEELRAVRADQCQREPYLDGC